MPKQNMILAVIVIAIAMFAFGYKTGGNSVRDEYQVAINKQKAEADKIIEGNINELIATQTQNNQFKLTIEKERQAHVQETNTLRAKYASTSLRFIPNPSGASDSNQMPNSANATSDTSATSVELPNEIATNLRELAYNCDTLRDDYAVLYKFNNGVNP